MARAEISLELLADLEAIHAGHHDIEQDHVRRLAGAGDAQGTLAAGGGLDVLSVFQAFDQEVDVGRLIVNDEDGLLMHRTLRSCSPKAQPAPPESGCVDHR
jgi:hypothetical protein